MGLFSKKPKCIHRHTIDEHPACFVKDMVKGEVPWYKQEGMKIGYLDIESDGLTAEWGTMLTWCIKEKDGPIYYGKISKEDLFNGTTDQRIVSELIDCMKQFRILVGYYSTNFDMKFIRTKAMRYKLPFPNYGEMFHFDLYYTVKSKMCLSRNSLDNACNYLGIVGKTPIDREIWRKAKYGDPEAIDEVLSHNMGDVEITEKLHEELMPFRKWIKTSL